MSNPNDVLPGSSPAPETPVIPPADPGNTPPVIPAPGSQTPPENLLGALHEERRLRKEAEERAERAEADAAALKEAGTPSVPDNGFSDEGKAIIEQHVKPLAETITSLQEQLVLKDLVVAYPALKDKLTDFEDFRKDYPRHKLENVAKLFLSERGLLVPTTRIGLETTTGGDRTPAPAGMSLADVKNLRETNYNEYKRRLLDGTLEIAP